MTSKEFDLMMAEALTIIGRNVPSLKHRFAYVGDWKKDAIRNHTLIATCGPLSIASMLCRVVELRENTGKILPSYISSIAANLRRMAEVGDDGDRPLHYPAEIPEKELEAYCVLLKRHGNTVCRAIYLLRYGKDFIKKSLSEHGCDVDVEVTDAYFEPMTIATSDVGADGYTRVAAVQPTVLLILKGGRECKR